MFITKLKKKKSINKYSYEQIELSYCLSWRESVCVVCMCVWEFCVCACMRVRLLPLISSLLHTYIISIYTYIYIYFIHFIQLNNTNIFVIIIIIIKLKYIVVVFRYNAKRVRARVCDDIRILYWWLCGRRWKIIFTVVNILLFYIIRYKLFNLYL